MHLTGATNSAIIAASEAFKPLQAAISRHTLFEIAQDFL